MCCPHTPQVSKRLRRDSPLARSAGPCRLSASFSPPMATGPARQGPATTGDSSIVWRRRKSCRWQPHQALKRPSGQLPLSPPGAFAGSPAPSTVAPSSRRCHLQLLSKELRKRALALAAKPPTASRAPPPRRAFPESEAQPAPFSATPLPGSSSKANSSPFILRVPVPLSVLRF